MARQNTTEYMFSILSREDRNRESNEEVEIHYSGEYFSTLPGILKVVETVMNFLLFLFIMVSHHSSLGRLSFLSLTGGVGFFITGLLLGCHVFHVVGKYKETPWLQMELANAAVWTVLLSIGSTVCLLYIGNGIVFGIVPFIGYINALTYGYDCYEKYSSVKKRSEIRSVPKV